MAALPGTRVGHQPMRPEPSPYRYLSLASVFVIALVTLNLAWPRWLASFRYLPVDIALDRYFESGEIPSDRLPVLIDFAHQAIASNDHYRFHRGLSVLHLLRAIDTKTPPIERRDAYIAAAAEARSSVQTAPAQSAVWLRLAYVSWVLHEEPADILAAWKMSIFTGRTDQSQFRQRLEIGIAHRMFMDEEAVAMLRDQIFLAWRGQPGILIGVLKSYDKSLAVTRPLVENSDPVAFREMEAWLEKLLN